jgi:hypothetical protein
LPVGARLRAKRYRCGPAVWGPQRGHFEDSIYFGHANNYWVAAVPPMIRRERARKLPAGRGRR